MLIDSHCHLDFPELTADRPGILARAKAAGIDGMVTISTRVERFDEIRAIAEQNPNVWCSVGTHPHHATTVTVTWLCMQHRGEKVGGWGGATPVL